MNKNVLIGILVAAVILIGGAFVFSSYSGMSPTATTTVTTQTQTTNTTQSQQNQTGAPTVITDGTNFFLSNSTALVTGKVTPNGAQTAYWYEYGVTPALGSRTSAQSVGSGFIAIPAPGYISGLSPSTSYYFRLRAQNAFGTVDGTTFTFTTNTNPPLPGSAPTTHTDSATDITRTTANLNGHVNPNNSATSYWFEYGETSEFGSATALQGAGSGNTSLPASVSISNLKPLTKYYFRLNSQNAYGTVNGSIVSFTTAGPRAPGAPQPDTTSATNISTSTATLNAKVNPEGDQTSYWFEYGTDSLLGNILGSTTKTAIAGNGTTPVSVSADITSLSSNTKYYFRVVAENSYGTVSGDTVTFTTHR